MVTFKLQVVELRLRLRNARLNADKMLSSDGEKTGIVPLPRVSGTFTV